MVVQQVELQYIMGITRMLSLGSVIPYAYCTPHDYPRGYDICWNDCAHITDLTCALVPLSLDG